MYDFMKSKDAKIQYLILAILIVISGQAGAQSVVSRMETAARVNFAAMPNVRIVSQIYGECGADGAVSLRVVYCTSSNQILVAADQLALPEIGYLLGHAFGHAVQVQHGVADVALRTIRARRQDEVVLRGYVDRQVDCIAGFLVAKAGFDRGLLTDWITDDPFDDIHWGRHPLKSGPVMPVPLVDRNIWFILGQSGDLAECAVGEFGADLLIAAHLG